MLVLEWYLLFSACCRSTGAVHYIGNAYKVKWKADRHVFRLISLDAPSMDTGAHIINGCCNCWTVDH